jgi:hypothetical protein
VDSRRPGLSNTYSILAKLSERIPQMQYLLLGFLAQVLRSSKENFREHPFLDVG